MSSSPCPRREAAKLLAQSTDVTGTDNFFQGCSFSPDGLCVLTSTAADGKLRLYNTIIIPNNNDDNDNDDDGDDNNDAVVKDWKTALVSVTGGDTVRSYAWYPQMNSNDPASCCFVATRRDQPVHLIDAYSGTVRASYRPYNNLDEMESPTVVCFSSNGQRIITGGFKTDRCIHVFDLAVPGGRVSTMLRLGKTRRSSDGQKGLVSYIASSPLNEKIFSVGTYSPGSIYIYDDRAGQQPSGTILNGVCIVGHGKNHARKKRRFTGADADTADAAAADAKDNSNDATTISSSSNTCSDGWLGQAKAKWFHARTQGGVTQVQFSPSQDYILYSASRRSGAVLCWDLRMLSENPEEYHQSSCGPIQGIGSFATCNDTNQRLEFDLDDTGEHLYIGGFDCRVRIYDTKSGEEKGEIANLQDAANGVSFSKQQQQGSPMNGKRLLAVATGSRHFPSQDEDFDQDDDNNDVVSLVRPLAPAADPASGYLRLFELTQDGDGDTDMDEKKEKEDVPA